MRKLYIVTFFSLIILIAKGNNESLKKRNLFESSDLKIYLDLFNFNETFQNSNLGNTKDIFINSMKEAKNMLETIFLIDTDNGENVGLIIKDDYKGLLGITSWNESLFIVGSTLEVKEYNMYILFKFSDLNNVDMISKIVFTYALMPLIGLVTINNNIDHSKLNQDYLTPLFLQQFIKILGFQIPYDSIEGEFKGSLDADIEEDEDIALEELTVNKVCVSKATAESVTNYATKYFDCPSIEEIELELDEYNNVYWPSKLLLGDIMTKFDNYEEKFISHFTLALLEATGYLHVKKEFAYTGGLMRFGKHKGCGFFSGNCASNDEHNDIIFSNEFYLPTDTTKFPEPSCSSSRLGKTVYILHPVGESDIPEKGYKKNGYTGLAQTNYCPIAEYTSKGQFITGFCSDLNTQKDDSVHEELGSESFCVLSSLISNQFKSVCYKMSCSSKSLTIKIGNDYIVCPQEGGQIQPFEYQGYLLCPDYNLICTTEKLCNSLFDCFKKKSVEKEDTLDYDYDPIKTTQNSNIYKSSNPELSQGWELSDDGFCPKLCMKCNSNKKCLKCKPGYKIHDPKENICYDAVPNCKNYINDEICNECKEGFFLVNEVNKCISPDDINSKLYFFDNELNKYVSCSIISNCMKCLSSNECISCQSGFELNNNICNKIVTDDDDKLSTGTIIGIVFGCVGFVLIVLCIIYFIFIKGKKDNSIPKVDNEEKKENKNTENKIKMEELDKQSDIEIYNNQRKITNNKV